MRDYAKVSPNFWTGKTGRALKAAGPETLVVALYLMTCQHANMIGLFYLDPTYVAVDTGLGLEGASKGLQRACEADFCAFDEETQIVWVKEMAAYQIGDQLDEKDNRCKGVQREYDSVPENPFLTEFYERYAQRFHMSNCRGKQAKKTKALGSPSKAPTKPGTGTGTGTRPSGGFDAFWAAYPSKVGKAPALKAFEKIDPDEALLRDMLAALADQKRSVKWLKDGGQFIPNPATWLNQQRWLDESGDGGAQTGLNLLGAI